MREHLNENHRSFGELFSELSAGTKRLFRDEIDLAKVEMSQKLSHLFKDTAFLIIGGFVGYAAFLVLLAAAVLGLATVLPLWLSALLIGLALCGMAYSLIQKGISDLRHRSVKPERTIQTLKEDVKWVKDQI